MHEAAGHAPSTEPFCGGTVERWARCLCGWRGPGCSCSAEMYGPPAQGAPVAPWAWTELPTTGGALRGCSGCVMSDGRFAVLGGYDVDPESSCQSFDLGGDDDAPRWEPMPSMHEQRVYSACAAVAGSIIVAGGLGRKSAEVYDEVLDRWFRLPHDFPVDGIEQLAYAGSALM